MSSKARLESSWVVSYTGEIYKYPGYTRNIPSHSINITCLSAALVLLRRFRVKLYNFASVLKLFMVIWLYWAKCRLTYIFSDETEFEAEDFGLRIRPIGHVFILLCCIISHGNVCELSGHCLDYSIFKKLIYFYNANKHHDCFIFAWYLLVPA